jgi:hypothetical protein
VAYEAKYYFELPEPEKIDPRLVALHTKNMMVGVGVGKTAESGKPVKPVFTSMDAQYRTVQTIALRWVI